jgi:hypothetical protein
MIDVEKELAELYEAPLDQFTTSRNDLAARLKNEGNEEGSALIKGLKKPSVSAWVVNQLVRNREVDMTRLLKAGEAIEEVQRLVLAGKPADFEKARKEEGAAVRVLRNAAKEVLPTISGAVLDRVTQSLRAASSREGRTQLRLGRLTEDLQPAGLETFAGVEIAPSVGKGTKLPNRRRALLMEKREEARAKVKNAEAEARDLEKSARAAEATAKKSTLAAEAARKRVELAQAELQKIEQNLAQLT